MARAADWFLDDVPAWQYLDARKLGAEDADSYRLGVVENPFPEHARFQGWLAIPYLGADSEALTLRFRCLANHSHREHGHGKYMTLAGDLPRVFNAPKVYARAPREVHVTEGEMDAIVLTKCGFQAVGIPGANNWHDKHRRLLAQYDAVYVWGDPDEAGASFAHTISQKLHNARIVHLTTGDVSDTYAAGGRGALQAALNNVRSPR